MIKVINILIKENIPRQQQLTAFLIANGLSKSQLAEKLGISPSRLSQILQGIYAHEDYIERLKNEFGIPAELLPKPIKRKKRK